MKTLRVKEDLVERVDQWPGVHCARTLIEGEPLKGFWFDRPPRTPRTISLSSRLGRNSGLGRRSPENPNPRFRSDDDLWG